MAAVRFVSGGWGEKHHHAATLKARAGFDDRFLRQLFCHPLHQIEGNVPVDDLTAAEADSYPHFGAILQELSRLVENDLNVMFARFWPQADFLDLDLLLSLARLPLPFLSLIEVFAVIHKPADRRFGIGRNLYQIQISILGGLQSGLHIHDAELRANFIDDPHLTRTNPVVDSCCVSANS